MGKLIDSEFAKELLSDLNKIHSILVEATTRPKEEPKKKLLWERLLAVIKDVMFQEWKPIKDKKVCEAIASEAIRAVEEVYKEWFNKRQGQDIEIDYFIDYLKRELLDE